MPPPTELEQRCEAVYAVGGNSEVRRGSTLHGCEEVAVLVVKAFAAANGSGSGKRDVAGQQLREEKKKRKKFGEIHV
jgi:hypothetical protein